MIFSDDRDGASSRGGGRLDSRDSLDSDRNHHRNDPPRREYRGTGGGGGEGLGDSYSHEAHLDFFWLLHPGVLFLRTPHMPMDTLL